MNDHSQQEDITKKAMERLGSVPQSHYGDREKAEKRAASLLRKVIGKDYERASLVDVNGFMHKVAFAIDGLTLTFIPGVTPIEDSFRVEYLGISVPKSIRTLAGLGEIIFTCRELKACEGSGLLDTKIALRIRHIFGADEDVGKPPATLSTTSAMMAAYQHEKEMPWPPTQQRAEDLLARILGNHAVHAQFAHDAEFGEIFFDIDDMQLKFVEGATPEDDYYLVTFMNVPAPNGFRTAAGLGKMLYLVWAELRTTGEYIAEGMTP
jgi:hypothetical protein